MNEPTITCPNCKTEIKLTESLAAPLIESTKKQYDDRIAAKEPEVARRQAAVREQARTEAEEGFKLKVLEKEQTIGAMQRQIEELKRRAEQGSQQLQGEVQELELESMLRTRFPQDTIEPVPKGEYGGDVLHRIL